MAIGWRIAVLLVWTSCYRDAPLAPTTPGVEPPPPTKRAVARTGRIAAGSFHTCAIDRGGRVWCWGHGIKGQAGPMGDHLMPVDSGIDDAIQVVAGEWFTCVLKRRGSVQCIGDNAEGQLKGVTRDAVAIGAGQRFACALLKDTSVTCWGQVPQGTPPSTGAKQLAVGDYHACALMNDGSIQCWGANNLMQLGATTAQPNNVVTIADVAGIAAGGIATCAWTHAGKAWCWGDRAFNHLGADGTGTQHVGREPALVPTLGKARSIAVGSGRACALDAQGEVGCWGGNYMGSLGLEHGSDLPPTHLQHLDQPIAEIAIGGRHTCVRAVDDSIACWGANYWGELGAGPIGSRWWPEPVALEPSVEAVLSGPPPAKPVRTGRAVSVATVATAPTISTLPSGARRVKFALDSEASMLAAKWSRIAGGQTSFANNVLTIRANGFEEWQLANPDFVANAGNPPGWAVEARFKLDKPCAVAGTGMWIHDGIHFVRLKISDTELVLEPSTVKKTIGPTNKMRVYRVEVVGKAVTVKVDGAVVLTATAVENYASNVLMFGALGDGCGTDASSWEYIAYEVHPAPPSRLPRDEWHPGVTRAQLVTALSRSLPKAAKANDALGDDNAPCIAMTVLDGAVRDLLPLAYVSLKEPAAAEDLRRLAPLFTKQARENALRQLEIWTQPEDRRGRGGPRAALPPVGETIQSALQTSEEWAHHPLFVVRSLEDAAKAYDEARVQKLAGASEAADRLVKRLAAIKPGTCKP